MKHWINRDTLLLRSHRYFIDGIEHQFVAHEEISGLKYRYRFRPIEGRCKAVITLTENKLFNNPHVQYLDPEEEPEEMASSYKLSVICRQRSDGITVYTAAIEWQFVSQFFGFEDSSLPPEERAQRALNPSHAKKIKQYLLDTPSYYLPPMIASVEVEGINFTPFEADFGNGILELPMSAIFRVIDGQHRTFAIREIMQGKEATRFKSELITVDLIANASLQLRQKIFREVNTLAKSVSRNLTTVYGDSAIAVFANTVLATIPLFSDQFTEKEKSSLNAKSDKLFVYKHLYDATIKMKPGLGDESDFNYCQSFWEGLVDAIAPWGELLDGDRTSTSVREHTVSAHGVTIHALGELGKYLGEGAKLSGNHNSHARLLKNLSDIDWHKTNPDWLHRVVDANGGMLSKRHNVKLMLNFFKVQIGVPEKNFSKADKELESVHIGNLGIFNHESIC